MVTITLALALQKEPSLVSAMATIFCVSASFMRVPTWRLVAVARLARQHGC